MEDVCHSTRHQGIGLAGLLISGPLLAVVVGGGGGTPGPGAVVWDTLVFGDSRSEDSHMLAPNGSTARRTTGAAGRGFRELPLHSSVEFSLNVDLGAPGQYLTLQLSGDDWSNASAIKAVRASARANWTLDYPHEFTRSARTHVRM